MPLDSYQWLFAVAHHSLLGDNHLELFVANSLWIGNAVVNKEFLNLFTQLYNMQNNFHQSKYTIKDSRANVKNFKKLGTKFIPAEIIYALDQLNIF